MAFKNTYEEDLKNLFRDPFSTSSSIRNKYLMQIKKEFSVSEGGKFNAVTLIEKEWFEDFLARMIVGFADAFQNRLTGVWTLNSRFVDKLALGKENSRYKLSNWPGILSLLSSDKLPKDRNIDFEYLALNLLLLNLVCQTVPFNPIAKELYVNIKKTLTSILKSKKSWLWSIGIQYVSINRSYLDDLDFFDDLWSSFESFINDDDELGVFKLRTSCEIIRVKYGIDEKIDNEMAIKEIDHEITKLGIDLTDSVDHFISEITYIGKYNYVIYYKLLHDKGFRLFRLNKREEGFKIWTELATILVQILERGITTEDDWGARIRELLQVIRLDLLNFDHEGQNGKYDYWRNIKERLLPENAAGFYDGAWKEIENAQKIISDFKSTSFDQADSKLEHAFHVFTGIRSLTGIAKAFSVSAEAGLNKALHSDSDSEITYIIGKVISAAALSGNDKLLIKLREIWESRGTPLSSKQRHALAKKEFLSTEPFCDIDKIAIANLAQNFLDQVDKASFLEIIERIAKWSSRGWSMNSRYDVARSSLKALEKAVELATEEREFETIVDGLKTCAIAHCKDWLVILAASEVAVKFMYLPDPIQKKWALPLARIVDQFELPQDSFSELAVDNFFSSLIEMNVSNDDNLEFINRKLPPNRKPEPEKNSIPEIDWPQPSNIFNTSSVESRLILGINIPQDDLNEYIEIQHKQILETYLANPPKLHFPGRFSTYIICTLQCDNTQETTIIGDIVNVLLTFKDSYRLQIEAINALHRYMRLSKLKKQSPNLSVEKILKANPFLIEEMWSRLKALVAIDINDDPFEHSPEDIAASYVYFIWKCMENSENKFKPSEVSDRKEFVKIMTESLDVEFSEAKGIILNLWAYILGMYCENLIQSQVSMFIFLQADSELRQRIYDGLYSGLKSNTGAILPEDGIFTLLLSKAIIDASSQKPALQRSAIYLLKQVQENVKLNQQFEEQKAIRLLKKDIDKTIEMIQQIDLRGYSLIRRFDLEREN